MIAAFHLEECSHGIVPGHLTDLLLKMFAVQPVHFIKKWSVKKKKGKVVVLQRKLCARLLAGI